MSRQTDPAGSIFNRLSIRSSLLLGFGALGGIMVLAVAASLLVSARVVTSVGDIVDSQLPTTVHTLRVARAADALVASGIPLAFLSTETERDFAFQQMENAQASLEMALTNLAQVQNGRARFPADLTMELAENLNRLREKVDQRIALKRLQHQGRAQLLANLQSFQQRLAYRIRILEGDGDVVRRQLLLPEPPLARIGELAKEMTMLLPLPRFYAEIESINGRLLAASQDSSPAALHLSQRFLQAALTEAGDTLAKLPEFLKKELDQSFAELRDLTLGENGLISLRRRELRIVEESQALNTLNQTILHRMNAATAELVHQGLNEIEQAGQAANALRHRSMIILVLASSLGLLGVALLLHFYVHRHVLARLSWLSTAMQDVAAGRLKTSLPPVGSNELGRLGAALHQFRDTAVQAKEREVTMEQARKAAEAATQAKSMFLANMSHEIRTPMNAVMGMTQLALRADPNSKVRDYLVKADIAAKSLLSIINDILDFSKIEAGHMELEHSPFSLAEVLTNLEAVIGVKAREKKLSLDVTVAPNTPNMLLGDPLRLGQILINLGSNAVKFTQQGGIHIFVTVEEINAKKALLRFIVQDSGIGLDAKSFPLLFDPFWQEDNSVTRKYGGTGLGLPICQQLVKMMGGTIEVQSAPGQGSTFSFTVRMEIADVETAPDNLSRQEPLSKAAAMPNADTLAGGRVLLVEDNALNIDLAVELLTGLGMTVEIAVNGQEGVQRATSEPFDLILMDIQMPEVDGYEATRRIRSQESEVRSQKSESREISFEPQPSTSNLQRLRRTPIIAMTAHAMTGDREKSLEAGMDDHLTKPIDPDILRQALLRWMPKDRSRKSGVRSQKSEGGRRKDGEQTVNSQVSGLIPQPSAPLHLSPFNPQPSLAPPLPPTLPPFDIPAALARCNNNPQLLRKLILTFAQEYALALEKLRNLLQDEKPTEAQRLAHSLKGAAATLEAGELTATAQAVETALRTGQTDKLEDLLQALAKNLSTALAAARTLAPDPAPKETPLSVDAASDVSQPDDQRMLTLLTVLHAHLKANSLQARKAFAEVKKAAAGTRMEADLAPLEAALENLDFPAALNLLDNLMAMSKPGQHDA